MSTPAYCDSHVLDSRLIISHPPSLSNSVATESHSQTPSLPRTFVHSSHAAKLHAHLTRPLHPPPALRTRSQNSQPSQTSTASQAKSPAPSTASRRRSPNSQSPSFSMTPYILPHSKGSTSSSFTEAAQNLATVPPPSPSPRRGRARAPQPRAIAGYGASTVPNNRHHPPMALPGRRSKGLPLIVAGEEVQEWGGGWMPSSLPARSSRLQNQVPIAGILQRKESDKGAKKIPMSKAGGVAKELAGVDRRKEEFVDCRSVSDGSFASFCSLRMPASVPLLSEDTIYPFRLGGSVIRPPPKPISFASSTSTKQKRAMRDLTNHAGLG